MTLYEQILEASKTTDERFASISPSELAQFETSFRTAPSHKRFATLPRYSYRVAPVESALLGPNALVIGDASVKSLPWLSLACEACDVRWLTPREDETKARDWLDAFIEREQLRERGIKKIVGLGGGIIVNAAGYVAEAIGANLTYLPTTVLAMADAVVSGKIRANVREGGAYRKHAYKSFYEPDQIVVDPRFLETLPPSQISVGLGEIVKHGVYQSRLLLAWLASDACDPFTDRATLLKAVLWAAELTAVGYEVDPEESADGAERIMRGGHNASDKIEMASGFTIPHGLAVAIAIYQEQKELGSDVLPELEVCMDKFRFPRSADFTARP